MSQDFYPIYSSGSVVQTNMQQIQNDNCDALRTSFEGTTAPGSPKASQFFSNLSAQELQIRNQDGTTWDGLYDFAGRKIILSTGQVEASHISDTARKGSLVQGEAIAPLSCTIQTQFNTVSLFSVPSEFYPLFSTPTATTGVGVLAGTGWTTLLSSKIYVPSTAGTLYAMAYQVTCNVRFIVSTETSTTTGIITGPGWGIVFSADLSSLSGWLDIDVQADTSAGGSPWGGIGGISFRWEA